MRSISIFWVLVSILFLPEGGWAQASEVRGRVLDRETGRAVPDATVVLEGPNAAPAAVTDGRGLFTFEKIEGGLHRVTVTHIAYGTHSRTVVVEPDAVVALRVLIDARAIELDPLVVEALSSEELSRRARATMRQEVTREEIERAVRTSNHLGDILRQTVPGLRVYDTSLPGARTCIEFRGRRSVRFARECQSPMVILDGVRMFDPPSLYNTIDPASIERIEVIPPAEAGLFYGSESAFGVITIETKLWLTSQERQVIPPHLRGGVYDWSVEVDGHPSKRAFLSVLAANAVGVAAGIALAGQCVEFEELDRNVFASGCDRLGTTGAWAAAFTLPLVSSALGARFSGSTALSRGRFLPAVAAGAVAILPGYALMGAASDRRASGSFRAGQVFVLVGIPVAVTLADRLFRSFRTR